VLAMVILAFRSLFTGSQTRRLRWPSHVPVSIPIISTSSILWFSKAKIHFLGLIFKTVNSNFGQYLAELTAYHQWILIRAYATSSSFWVRKEKRLHRQLNLFAIFVPL
jgi:hypothetical protein